MDLSKQFTSDGFTMYLVWWPARYIVWLTNNKVNGASTRIEASYGIKPLLIEQALEIANYLPVVTIWGREDKDTSVKYLDIWTATDSLDRALQVWKSYKQYAIRDSVDNIEIKTGYEWTQD